MMLSGIEQALRELEDQIRIQPDDADLKRTLEDLQTLDLLSKNDKLIWIKINDFCNQLTFGSASSSSEKSQNQIASQQINAFLKEIQSPPRRTTKQRGFMPNFNQAQPSIAPHLEHLNEINNYCNIFEDESRFDNNHLVIKLITDLASQEDADKAPMPRLTRCAIQGGGAKGAAYAGTYEAMDLLGVTDSTKTYCGASAGAITSFSMGLGYNSEQFNAISSAMNFQDLADYNESMFGAKVGGTAISQAVSAFTKLHVHSGDGFYNWAKSQCAMVFGDPDITFIEMQEWYQARGLPAPEMVFTGSMVNPESKKVVFSAKETPHIRIADAVRASMSFPIAWEHFEVKYGKSISRDSQQLRDGNVHGLYADGGILNNYPIDELNTANENPAYHKPLCRNASETIVPLNPCSYGFSLTSSLNKFDDSKTPMTKRLKILKQRTHGRTNPSEQSSDVDFERRTTDTKLRSNKFWNLMAVLKKNYLGDTATSVQDELKRTIFDRQTSLIYTEGVGTLEFNLTPHKKKLIEDSGKMAFINWYIKYRNPSQTYDEFYHSKNIGEGIPYDAKRFEGDATLSSTDIKKLEVFGFKDKKAFALQKYCRLMIDLHDEFTMLRKVIALNQDPEIMAALSEDQKQRLAQFNDLNSNQRLKHLSWQIENLAKNYPFLKEDQALEINKAVFNIIRERSELKEAVKLQRKQELDTNINKLSVIRKIHTLLEKKNPQSTNLAIAIFKGQMSCMFDLMKIDPSLFSALSEHCDSYQLEDLVNTLRSTAHQLDQQGRSWHGDFGLLKKLENETLENFADRFQLFMEKFAYPSPLEIAIKQGDRDKIQFILAHKSKSSIIKGQLHYFNPLASNNEGKNALHICVDVKNFDTFSQILTDSDSTNLPFSANGQHLLHYVIENGSAEFISQLLSTPQTVEWLKKVINASGKSNPGFCSRFGCGESLRDQIVRIAATKAYLLDFKSINELLQLKAPINQDVIMLYDPQVNSSANQKDLQYLQAFLSKNVDPNNIPEFGPAEALRCLTLPDPNGKILMELAAGDDSNNKQHLELALKLISICQKDHLINTKLNELYKVKFSGDKTLLYLAVEHHNYPFVDLCLANGSSIDMAGPFHQSSSALTCAAESKDYEMLEKLISSKVPFVRSISDNSGKNALHYLAMDPNCPPELYFKIASKGAILTAAQYLKIDSPNINGMTPFDYLIENNRYDIIDRIVSQKTKQTWYVDNYFNIFNLRIDGKTSLQSLVEKASAEKVDVVPSYKPLLKLILTQISEAGLSTQDSNGKSVLHYLAESDKAIVSPEAFSHYLVKGTKSTIPGLSYQSSATYHQLTGIEDNNANSIFRSIINHNRYDIIEYFNTHWKGWNLNAIFDLQSIRSDGLSDFEYLMSKVSQDKTPELFSAINAGMPPGMQRDSQGQTKLHHLIDEPNSAKKVWEMLTAGLKTWSPTGFRESFEDYQAQTSLCDLNNQTLLRHIIVNNRTDILDMLKDKTGSSLVGMTTESARWYLDHYFDMTLTDQNGVTDLEYASNNATPEVKNILFSRLSPDCLTTTMASRDSRGWSPLHYVASDASISPKAFWELINRGQGKGDTKVYHERTNVEDANGDTPFRLLIANNRMDVLKELASHCTTYTGWNMDHYVNLKVKRPDGMNDLEYLIFKAKTDPSLSEFLKLVEKSTTTATFKKASVSVNKNYDQFARQVAELKERMEANAALESRNAAKAQQRYSFK